MSLLSIIFYFKILQNFLAESKILKLQKNKIFKILAEKMKFSEKIRNFEKMRFWIFLSKMSIRLYARLKNNFI